MIEMSAQDRKTPQQSEKKKLSGQKLARTGVPWNAPRNPAVPCVEPFL